MADYATQPQFAELAVDFGLQCISLGLVTRLRSRGERFDRGQSQPLLRNDPGNALPSFSIGHDEMPSAKI
jgi:hypothetical protein